jgi:flagellar assembly protein FliH
VAVKPWLEQIRFAAPLCDVRPAGASKALPLATAAGPDFAPDAAPAIPPTLDLEKEIEAAYERGRVEGERSVGQQLLQQRQEMQELLNGVVLPLQQAVSQVVHDTETTVSELALEIARKLVADFPIEAGLVEAVVKDAMSQVEDSAEFHIKIHPSDLALLVKAESPLLTPSATNSHKVHFQPSPDVSRGGCIVQTRFGTIDARRETKLDLLRNSLQSA